MGEYADMALEAGFSCWSDEEPDEYIGRPFRCRPALKTCNRCGEDGLHWERDDDGWRLFETVGFRETRRHECNKAPEPDQ